MNARQAKRVALGILARYAQGRAEDGRREASHGFHLFAPEAITPSDTSRVCLAFEELATELERRLTGERRPQPPVIDPAQLSWLDIEVMSP